MSTPLLISPIVKAGWLVQLLGLLYLLFTIYLGISVLPLSHGHDEHFDPWNVAILLAFLAYSICYVIVGQGMKGGKAWAKTPGVVLLALAAINIPIGTVIAAVAFYYLAQARKSANLVA